MFVSGCSWMHIHTLGTRSASSLRYCICMSEFYLLYSVYSCHVTFTCLHIESHWTYQALCLTRFLSSSFLPFLPPGSQGGNSLDLYGPVTLSMLEDSLRCCFGLSFPPLWLANVLLGNIIVYSCFFILLNKIDTLLLENNLCTSCL